MLTDLEAPLNVALAEHPYLVSDRGGFTVAGAPNDPPAEWMGRKAAKKELERLQRVLDEQQRMLYSRRHHSVLLVFQAMDAAGKDSTK